MDQPLLRYLTWGIVRKISFRFFFLYYFFIIFFWLAGVSFFMLPYVNKVQDFYNRPWTVWSDWVTQKILHIKSFDFSGFWTSWAWSVLFSLLLLITIITIIWSVADRKRNNYNELLQWLIIYVRYYVGFTMILYGVIKIFENQFPFPDLSNLNRTYIDSTPGAIMHTFMGASRSYTLFTAFGEMIGGTLLLFRRTVLLGTLIVVAVMSNVVMINFSYDFGAKFFSFNVLLMALFLLTTDMKRVVNLFLLNKPVPATEKPLLLTRKWLKTARIILKPLLIIYVLFFYIDMVLEGQKKYGRDIPKPPLYGIYNVITFVRVKDTLPPLTTDSIRWNKMIVNRQDWQGVEIKLMNDKPENYNYKPDTLKKSIILVLQTDTIIRYVFNYQLPEKDILVLQGKWKGDSVYIRMRKYDINKSRFFGNKFRWI